MNSRKPLTAGQIEELKQLCANYANPCCGVVEADVWKAFNALPRLLSMLTPPPDAAVKEAVERLSAGVNGPWEGSGSMFADIRTLLRAVQAPRLTAEQADELATCVKDRGEWMAACLKAQDECNRAKARLAEVEDAVESERELYGTQLTQMLSRAESAEARVPESDDVAEALAEISAAGLGGVAEGLRLHISDLTRRLAEAEVK